MACTEAVETEIDRHYGRQLEDLGDDDPELAADIAEFRADELRASRRRPRGRLGTRSGLSGIDCGDPWRLAGSQSGLSKRI